MQMIISIIMTILKWYVNVWRGRTEAINFKNKPEVLSLSKISIKTIK